MGIEDVELKPKSQRVTDNVEFQARRVLKELETTKEGKAKKSLHNLAYLLEHDPALRCMHYNELRNQIEIQDEVDRPEEFRLGAIDDTFVSRFRLWMERNRQLAVGKDMTESCLDLVKGTRSYDPLHEYLYGLEWDGKPRTLTWLQEYLLAEDTQETRLIGQKFLISAVARGLDFTTPKLSGETNKVDTVLVLVGAQGTGKSTVVKTLGGRFAREGLAPIETKDAVQGLRGNWIIELAELASIRGKSMEMIKSFVTKTVDSYRPSYGRRDVECVRRCVFVGTTNEMRFLEDHTGNRRFWPVVVGNEPRTLEARMKRLKVERDQILAEAKSLFLNGTPWHMDPGEEAIVRTARVRHEDEDPWLAIVEEYLQTVPAETKYLRLKTVFENAVSGRDGMEHFRKLEQRRLAVCMRECGWENKLVRDGQKIIRGWARKQG